VQISSNAYSSYSTYQNAGGSKAKSDGGASDESFASLANYGSSDNTIFQNLLDEPSVQDNISVNEDGTYTFSYDGTSTLSTQETIARLLVSQQNGYTSEDPGAVSPYSTSELENFRQLTGYNLIQAGGLYTVVDDYGNPPATDDQTMVQAAWDAFDLAKGANDLTDSGADITKQDLLDAITGLRNAPGANQNLYDALFNMVSTSWSDDA